MKCNYCGSEWSSNDIRTNCPFCGKELIEKNNDSFTDALKMLIDKYGHNIIESTRIIGLLMDCNPKEVQKTELMRIFVNKGVNKTFLELYNDKNSNWEDIREYCIKKLQEDAFLGYDYASTIIDDIGCAYGYSRICEKQVCLPKNDNVKKEIRTKNNERNEIADKEIKIDYTSFINKKVDGAGTVLTKVSVGGLTFRRFDVVTLENDEEYMCFAFCKFIGKYFILCEKVKENVHDVTTSSYQTYTKHFRVYKIYNVDSEGYFDRVVDNTTILAVLPYLASSLKKGVGYQTVIKKLLPEIVSLKDIEAAKNSLRDIYEKS